MDRRARLAPGTIPIVSSPRYFYYHHIIVSSRDIASPSYRNRLTTT
jgi:hypothetical protein